jgi:outer membrane usher protein
VQATDNFKALSVGAGRNTAIGAISLDLTHSMSNTFGETLTGNSLRPVCEDVHRHRHQLHSRRLSLLDRGYRTLTEHVEELSRDGQPRTGNSKTRTDLTVNQSLGRNQEFGSVYINASDQRYWGRGGSQSLSAGYSNYWGGCELQPRRHVYQRCRHYGPANNDTLVNLSVSFPLGSSPRAPRAFVSASTQKSSDTTQMGINGYLSEDSDTYYSVQAGNSSTAAALVRSTSAPAPR